MCADPSHQQSCASTLDKIQREEVCGSDGYTSSTVRFSQMESQFLASLPSNGEAILVCSLPSFGNIGQMALDCLLSTLASQNLLEHVGYATSKYLYPMCGYEQFILQEKKRLCLPIEGRIDLVPFSL